MLDTALLAKVLLVGALTAAVAMRLATWGAPRPWRRGACWSWAIGAGILAASGAAAQWPHWPPLEDRARFLTLLVPLTVAVETLAAAVRQASAVWTMRLFLAAVVAPILLYNSVYLVKLDGRNSAEWSPAQATMVLCGLAALLALLWAMSSGLQSRASTPAVLWLLTLDALATALTVMLSGYYRAGLLGLGLAGSLAGAALASHICTPQSRTGGGLGMGVIGIFAVVLVGRFFGNLSTGLAACLLLAPLLAWAVELPRFVALAPGWRGAGRLICVAIPLIAVVIAAERRFTAASTARSRSLAPSAIGELLKN